MLLGKPDDCLFLKSSPPHSTSPAWELRRPRVSSDRRHHHPSSIIDDCPFGCPPLSLLLFLCLDCTSFPKRRGFGLTKPSMLPH